MAPSDNDAPDEIDREIGQIAADAVVEQHFPDFEFVFADKTEPQLVYRNGDSFIVLETEVIDDSDQEREKEFIVKDYYDGLDYERGTKQYLIVSIDSWLTCSEILDVAAQLKQALESNCVRYGLVTAVASDTEITAVNFTPFDL